MPIYILLYSTIHTQIKCLKVLNRTQTTMVLFDHLLHP